ncbi:MAG TPA: SDR family oxidoreductase [Candidatus Binataceae bacterium]|nr:SDR family oxidoreductase [Candidatus Binataceae bacterium]
MAGLLHGKVALITGAGSGIGRATSLIFAREGARLALSDIVAEAGEETLRMVKQAGGEAIFVRTDVSRWAEVEALVARVVATYGRLDCAFNNAGIDGKMARTAECAEEVWNRTIAVNLTGVFFCMKAEIPQMLKQGGGAIVNTASAAGLSGSPGLPAYVASKHGVVGLTRAAAIEYGREKIRVNCVCPGPIRTPMLERLLSHRPEMEKKFASAEPLKRLGDPAEIGEAVAWLCSDAASYVTGHPMSVDGGYMAR